MVLYINTAAMNNDKTPISSVPAAAAAAGNMGNTK